MDNNNSQKIEHITGIQFTIINETGMDLKCCNEPSAWFDDIQIDIKEYCERKDRKK